MIALPLFAASLVAAATGHFTLAWALLLVGFCDAVFGGYRAPAAHQPLSAVERINEYVPKSTPWDEWKP